MAGGVLALLEHVAYFGVGQTTNWSVSGSGALSPSNAEAYGNGISGTANVSAVSGTDMYDYRQYYSYNKRGRRRVDADGQRRRLRDRRRKRGDVQPLAGGGYSRTPIGSGRRRTPTSPAGTGAR